MLEKLQIILQLIKKNNTQIRIATTFLWIGLTGDYVSTHPIEIWTILQEVGAFSLGLIFIWGKR